MGGHTLEGRVKTIKENDMTIYGNLVSADTDLVLRAATYAEAIESYFRAEERDGAGIIKSGMLTVMSLGARKVYCGPPTSGRLPMKQGAKLPS